MRLKKYLLFLALPVVLCLFCIFFRMCDPTSFNRVNPIQADRVVLVHQTKYDIPPVTVTINDAEAVAEVTGMYNSLRIQATSRPMEEDWFKITFYQNDEITANWTIGICEDSTILTGSMESFGPGNYRVESEFDYSRLTELFEEEKVH